MGFTKLSFDFLKGLEANNNRDWYHAHKVDHKSYLEAPFMALLDALTNRLSDAPRPMIGDKKTMFRLNRDTRFSQNKTPYKTAVSGMLTTTGVKGEGGLLYLHCEVGGGFLACGYYGMSPKDLVPKRQSMIEREDAYGEVLEALNAAGRALDMSMSLSSMPRGFAEHTGHVHADHIKLKSYILREDLTEVDWTSGDVVDKAERLARDAMPLLKFHGRS